jgi:hypothetical protein
MRKVKGKFFQVNILITVALLCFLAVGLLFTFAYDSPKQGEVKTATGTVEKFKWREDEWYDYLFGGSASPYFRLWLTDDSFYEATGMYYDNVDKALYEILQSGEEITVGYIDNGWVSPNDLVSIEYKGVCYLRFTDILEDFEKSNKTGKIVGLYIIGVACVFATAFYILNFKKNSGRAIGG